ncbi:MAG: hypothetical protein M1493_07070 [Firmicutes bacterium]|nr:hypothetical protein [Bacillota bacterium]
MKQSSTSNVSAGIISPNNTQTGDCGTASIAVRNAGSGYANISLTATSTQGRIIYESNAVSGSGPDGAINNSGSGFPFSANWNTTYHDQTGFGYVAVTGVITVETDNGSTCVSKPLASSGWIIRLMAG